MPILKEAIESLHEADLEIQKSLTSLKILMHQSSTSVDEGKCIKSYKRELEMESELKWLSSFLDRQKTVCRSELDAAKESINRDLLRSKCEQLERAFKVYVDEDNEDFGEE
ncbi:hypothetical protein PAPHI01_1643 [Pancytospora philotis]|nr:hypothetical protein PAPHI01_1643 [Pancytospora philotis]